MQKQMDITKHQKERIFRNLSYKLGGIQLDSKCTQSSINQILHNNKYVTSRMDKLFSSKNIERTEKNEIKNIVKNKLTELVYEKQFKGECLEKLRMIAAKEAINQIRRYSAPF